MKDTHMPDYILNDSNGLSNSSLALANAGVEDVIAGKTFYARSKDLKTGTLVKGERLLVYYVDWNAGGSFMNVLDTNLIQKLSEGDYGNRGGGTILKFLKSGTYNIYTYASASNDNQDGYVMLGSEYLVRAHINNQLTQKAVVSRYVQANTSISVRHGGYSGVSSLVITTST